MRTYTTQEAAELTGSTVRALRKRIERGQLLAVQHGRYWRIPHSELERCGLIGPDGGTEAAQRPGDLVAVFAALERERAERRRLDQEIALLRFLTAHVVRITKRLQGERAERLAAEARAADATDAAEALQNGVRELAFAGFFTRRRMLRELRRQAT